jgi:hypothetical protein
MIQAKAVCPQCGYSLEGLDSESRCPECGAPYDGRQLVVHGVMKSAGLSMRRRLAWIGLTVLWILLLYGWPFLLLIGSAIGGISVIALLLAATIGMVFSGKGEQHGMQAVAFTQAGIGFFPHAGKTVSETPVRFVAWTGRETIHLKRILPTWKKLRVFCGDLCVVDLGFRCPDQLASPVHLQIMEMIQVAREASIDEPASTSSEPSISPPPILTPPDQPSSPASPPERDQA